MGGNAESGRPKAERVNPNEGAGKRGRPRGSRAQRLPAADVTRCRYAKCATTQRSPHTVSPRVVNHPGVFVGHPENRVIFRRTKCLDCGLGRVDGEWGVGGSRGVDSSVAEVRFGSRPVDGGPRRQPRVLYGNQIRPGHNWANRLNLLTLNDLSGENQRVKKRVRGLQVRLRELQSLSRDYSRDRILKV